MQQPLHRHRTDLHLRSQSSVAPAMENHVAHHLALTRLQLIQQLTQRHQPFLSATLLRSRQLLEPHLLQGQGAAELAMPQQQAPGVLIDAKPLTQLQAGGVLQLARVALQALLKLGLPAWQPHAGSVISEVVEDGPADVRSCERFERRALIRAIQLGCPDQPQQSDLMQILQGFLAAAGVVQGQGPDQMPVTLDAAVPATEAGRGPGAGLAAAGGGGADGLLALRCGDGHELDGC